MKPIIIERKPGIAQKRFFEGFWAFPDGLMAAFRVIIQMTKTFLKRFGSWFGGWDDTKERSDEKRLFYIHVNQEKVLKISQKAKQN